MLISLIIPVYNVSEHLEKCLDSIFVQEFDQSSFEVVIVNDGSTDNSFEICQKYQNLYSNIILVNQENKGLSGARNSGLNIATGEYVWFIDSDDWITPNSIQEIYSKILLTNPQVLVVESADFIDNINILRNDLSVCSQNRATNIEYLKSSAFEVGAIIYILNRNFLIKNNFYFYEGIYHEDNEFTYRLIYETENIDYLSKVCYVVNLREGSITRSINPKRSFDLLVVCKILNNYVYTRVNEKDKTFFINTIAMLFNNALFNISTLDSKIKKDFESAINTNLFLLKVLKESNILKYKVEGYLMSFSRKNKIKIYELMKYFHKT